MDIRMMGFDMDGTLYGSNGEFPEINCRALQECERRGIKLVFCSGRPFETLREFAKKVGVNPILASYNGARIDETINGPTLKELLPEIFEKGGDVELIVRERGLGAVSDESALEAFVDQAIAANPGPVADFKAGKKAAAGFFVGQVMKLSKGKADPKIVGGLVAKKLAELCA